MDAKRELRARQAPLKERYREDPDAAVTPAEARGSFADPGITATVSYTHLTLPTICSV